MVMPEIPAAQPQLNRPDANTAAIMLHEEYLRMHNGGYTREMGETHVPPGFVLDRDALYNPNIPFDRLFDTQNLFPVSPKSFFDNSDLWSAGRYIESRDSQRACPLLIRGMFGVLSNLFNAEIRTARAIVTEAKKQLGGDVLGVVVRDVVDDREECRFGFILKKDLWKDPDTLKEKILELDEAQFEREDKSDASFRLHCELEAKKLAHWLLTEK